MTHIVITSSSSSSTGQSLYYWQPSPATTSDDSDARDRGLPIHHTFIIPIFLPALANKCRAIVGLQINNIINNDVQESRNTQHQHTTHQKCFHRHPPDGHHPNLLHPMHRITPPPGPLHTHPVGRFITGNPRLLQLLTILTHLTGGSSLLPIHHTFIIIIIIIIIRNQE